MHLLYIFVYQCFKMRVNFSSQFVKSIRFYLLKTWKKYFFNKDFKALKKEKRRNHGKVNFF